MHAVARPKDACLSVSVAYDAIAADYDRQVVGDAWMRRVLHQHYRRVFRPGERVLDVGCGTGLDSLALAQFGVRVVGVDGSPAMIDQLRPKMGDLVEARVLPIEQLNDLDGEVFDGVVSGFASLNSVTDLDAFAATASRLLRPGGRMVLHMLNRFSLWEWLGYISRGTPRAARQVGHVRQRTFVIGGVPVTHNLYFADEAYRRFFASRFARRGQYGLGVVRPPHTVRRIPGPIVASLENMDPRTGGWPLLRDAGRFFVLDLERLPT
jgi:ubiquinone/menaquinone biosynthesis C-methylase UbiE